jgi:cytochrome c551/c552
LQAKLQVPADVDAILKRSCYDCHSFETRWPWYSNVAPASWLLADDVSEGREHMNFSDWAQYDEDDAEDLFEDIAKEVRKGGMPLSSYTMLHSDAVLSEEDKRKLIDWAQAEHRRLKSLPH